MPMREATDEEMEEILSEMRKAPADERALAKPSVLALAREMCPELFQPSALELAALEYVLFTELADASDEDMAEGRKRYDALKKAVMARGEQDVFLGEGR